MWPEIWSSSGTVRKFTRNKDTQYPPEKFNVFVNNNDFFVSNLPKFKITNIQKKFLTFENPYFVSCCVAYARTYLCGISAKNFQDETSNLISSIAKYHFYYQMKLFLRTPEKLKTHMTDKEIEFVRKHIPVKYIWKWESNRQRRGWIIGCKNNQVEL